jgi:hypothetical protein
MPCGWNLEAVSGELTFFLWSRRSVVRDHPTVPHHENLLWFQQRIDRLGRFARSKYKERHKLLMKMAGLKRLKNGEFLARKGIPADVRDAYERLYGVHWEAQLRLPAGTSKHEAKRRGTFQHRSSRR